MSNARTNRNPVSGILAQFKELVGVLAVALCDSAGEPIALVGEPAASAALAEAVRKLLDNLPRDGSGASAMAELFDESDEYSVPRGEAGVNLLLRRVGDDWGLAAVWTNDASVDQVRSYAAETAFRLEAVS